MMDTTFLTLGAFLIVVGFLLLVGELFLTSGLLFVLALASLAVGVVFLFRYDTMAGVVGLVAVVVGIPAGGYLIIRLLPNAPLAQLARQPSEEPAGDLPHHQELQALRGRVGKTLTPLRPAGMVSFDGRRIDCVTEGMMVEAGKWVRCVDVHGGTVTVREVDKPDNFDLETAVFT
jgi:membrane-bound serine protease (ClpP class)